eukprot:gene1939-2747_t
MMVLSRQPKEAAMSDFHVDPSRAGFIAALAAAWLLGGCGGGNTGASAGDDTPQAAAVSQPGELTSFVQQRLRRLNASGELGAGTTGGDLVP